MSEFLTVKAFVRGKRLL